MKNRKIIPAIALGAIAAGAATYYFVKRKKKEGENGRLSVTDRGRGIRHIIYSAKRFQHGHTFN
jgi:LPXTG-motif cell wall-anchored protein